ncbi:unnamed protein product [Heterobilharzia americana]|nr:unnamed protein product [Heterobilharzia americana]
MSLRQTTGRKYVTVKKAIIILEQFEVFLYAYGVNQVNLWTFTLKQSSTLNHIKNTLLFLFTMKKSNTKNGVYKLEKFLLPDVDYTNDDMSIFLEPNQQKYLTNMMVTSLYCKPLERILILLLQNGSIIQINFEMNLFQSVSVVTDDCKLHFDVFQSDQTKVVPTEFGYLIIHDSTHIVLLLEPIQQVNFNALICHEFSHLWGSPSVVITREEQFNPVCSSKLRDISVLFLENRAFFSWKSCAWDKQYQNPSSWHKWSYSLKISSTKSSSVVGLVEQKDFNETMKHEISDLSKNTQYQLQISVQQSDQKFVLHGKH